MRSTVFMKNLWLKTALLCFSKISSLRKGLEREIIILLLFEQHLLIWQLPKRFELLDLERAFCVDKHLHHSVPQRICQPCVGLESVQCLLKSSRKSDVVLPWRRKFKFPANSVHARGQGRGENEVRVWGAAWDAVFDIHVTVGLDLQAEGDFARFLWPVGKSRTWWEPHSPEKQKTDFTIKVPLQNGCH